MPLRKVKVSLIVRFVLPNSVAEGNPSWLTVSSRGPYDAMNPEEPYCRGSRPMKLDLMQL